LEDDEDAPIETMEDSPHLEWWEEEECKAEEEEDEMLEKQEALLESFKAAHKEKTHMAAVCAVRVEPASPHGTGHVPACPPVSRQ
jgi:hypothetical protein